MYMTRKKKSNCIKGWVVVNAGEGLVLEVQGLPEQKTLREDTQSEPGVLSEADGRPCESRGDEGKVEGEVFKTKGKKE